jgi:hypothetical protein
MLAYKKKTDGEENCFYYRWPPRSFFYFHVRHVYNFCPWLWADGHSHLLRLVGMYFSFLQSNKPWQRQPPRDKELYEGRIRVT